VKTKHLKRILLLGLLAVIAIGAIVAYYRLRFQENRGTAKSPLIESEAIRLARGYIKDNTIGLLSADLLPARSPFREDNVVVSFDIREWPDKLWVIEFRNNVTVILNAYTGAFLSGPLDYSPSTGDGALSKQVPTINIDPTEGHSGTGITIRGKGFDANKWVYVYFDGECKTAAVTDNAGAFESYFQIFLRGGEHIGDHYVEATYIETYNPKEVIASAKFTILKTKYGELALLYVSTTYSIPLDSLIFASEQEMNLPVLQLKYWLDGVDDPDITGGDFAVCFDDNGHIVSQMDLVNREKEAAFKKYGKLSIDLYDLLENIGSNEMVKVGIWVNGPTEPLADFLRGAGFDVIYVSRYAPLLFANLPKRAILDLQEREDVSGIYQSITYAPD
jgi:hypothetical protein